jgi:hydrogenase/urease accessory protein HupE
MTAGGILDYIWLGAEHMVTGYDHLLFLFGVIFFLTGFRDVVRFITAFTLGHCITLLGATLAGITANVYLIDAVIALSVVYKGFENLDGFQKTLGFRAPNLLAMVFIFGLVHGFGLSTRLQELTLGNEGLVSRILAFNVGVELGQVAALTVMLGIFAAWRSSKTFERFGKVANVGLVLAGVGLFGFQVTGYLGVDDHHAHPAVEEAADQGDDHGTAGARHHAPATDPPAQDAEPSPVQPAPEPAPKAEAAQTSHKHKHGRASSKSRTKKHKHEHRHGSGKKHSH